MLPDALGRLQWSGSRGRFAGARKSLGKATYVICVLCRVQCARSRAKLDVVVGWTLRQRRLAEGSTDAQGFALPSLCRGLKFDPVLRVNPVRRAGWLQVRQSKEWKSVAWAETVPSVSQGLGAFEENTR